MNLPFICTILNLEDSSDSLSIFDASLNVLGSKSDSLVYREGNKVELLILRVFMPEGLAGMEFEASMFLFLTLFNSPSLTLIWSAVLFTMSFNR